jgi:hypothetical protein
MRNPRGLAPRSVKIAVLMSIMVGCSGSLTSDLNSDGTGDLVLSIADKPVNNVAHVYVTLEKVTIHNTDTGWITINDFSEEANGELKVDLLQLRFDDKLLGQETLPTGRYEQIRLYVAAKENNGGNPADLGKSYVVYKDETKENIFIPSGIQSGLKINQDSGWEGITIENGSITRLVLDNNVAEIMHETGSGKIILKPTAIDVVNKVVSGNIEGRILADVDADGTVGPDEVITDKDVIVKATQNGDVIKTTVATIEITEVEQEDGTIEEKPAGSYLLRGLNEGTYKIKVEVKNDADEIVSQFVHAEKGIDVEAEKTTTIDTIKLTNTNSQ